MLVSFTLGNFRSFCEPETLSLKALPRLRDEAHGSAYRIVTARDGLDLLKCVSIYGANASGKSNLLEGLNRMQKLVLGSRIRSVSTSRLAYAPFAFSQESLGKPTTFEVEVLLDASLYRYGFEFSQDKVVAEWLCQDEALLFERDGSNIKVSSGFPDGNELQERTGESVLFLSVCSSFNGEISKKITRFWQGTTIRCSGNALPYGHVSRSVVSALSEDEELRERVVELVKRADTGISDLVVVKDDEESSQDAMMRRYDPRQSRPTSRIEVVHQCNAPNALPFQEESEGTRKLVRLLIPFIEAIKRGSLIIVDELDTNIHPLLFDMLVEMFQSPANKTGQLVYTAHNTYPLRNETLQREQVWFVEKRRDMSSTLVNLAEYKKHPKESREVDYLDGRYGGIPQLDTFDTEGGVS